MNTLPGRIYSLLRVLPTNKAIFAGEVMARLVLVPCSQEARGLDAGPRLVERLGSISDHRTASIVARISREELAHVAVGPSLPGLLLQPIRSTAEKTATPSHILEYM